MPFLPPNQQRQTTEGRNIQNSNYRINENSTQSHGGGGRPAGAAVLSGVVVWTDLRTSAFCVGVRPAVTLRRQTHSDTDQTQNTLVGPTQFTSPHQTWQNSPVCVLSGMVVWIGQLLITCSDFKFSISDSLELSGIQFTPPKRMRHRQDSFVMSGVAVWITFKVEFLFWHKIEQVAGVLTLLLPPTK